MSSREHSMSTRHPLLRTSHAGALAGLLAAVLLLWPAPVAALAQEAPQETGFVLNTFSFLIWGALVMWMSAGFTMLEAGSVKSKNASVICLKNIGIYAIAGLTYYFIGYGLMYVDVSGFIGSIDLFYGPSADEIALLDAAAAAEAAAEAAAADLASAALAAAAAAAAAAEAAAAATVVESGNYAVTSDWFFQMVFVATTASIVSGALAERVNLWAFFVFTAVLTAFIYPVVGAWHWGGGWLAEMGFQDFAGSTVVHSTGGWAALAGALVVGPRWGKFRKDGSVKSTPPSNIPVVTLGVFILWLGWFGFNGGSQLALDGAVNAVAMSNILVNTNLAAAAGVITALLVARRILGRLDLFVGLNGALAGLVAITAGPDIHDPRWAIAIGAVGAVVCTLGVSFLERRRIDDVVGAVPAHLFAGIWGTLATSIVAGANLGVQLIGVLSVGAFVFGTSWVLWTVLEKTMGARVSRTVEEIGQDAAELGLDAYPEFVLMVDPEEGNDYRDP